MENALEWKKVTLSLAEGFLCKSCKIMMKNIISVEKLNDDVKIVEEFCYLGEASNASGGLQTTVVARTRIKWMKF